MRPELKKGNSMATEDIQIWNGVVELGTRWVDISEKCMPSRGSSDISDRWGALTRKKRNGQATGMKRRPFC